MNNEITLGAFNYIARVAVKNLFKRFSLMTHGKSIGFAINQVTVLFNINGTMEISFFETNGKSTVKKCPIPDNEYELLRQLKSHCGEEIIQKQLKP